MARAAVIDLGTGARVPFLRGILTRSLQAAGLPFEVAYRVASEVREELTDRTEIDSGALRELVAGRLEEAQDVASDVVESYRKAQPIRSLEIRLSDASTQRYSRGRHRESLIACGIGAEQSEDLATELRDRLVREGVNEVDLAHIKSRTHGLLEERLGAAAARRYLAWEAFRHGDRPLVLVIGGSTGTGKSTVATRIAHRMDVVRTQSTDMLREVMRTIVPDRLAPALHVSSFEAHTALPQPGAQSGSELLIEGYLTQSRLISVAAEAIVGRAARERVSVILEGVHLHPALQSELLADLQTGGADDPIVVRALLGVLSPKELRRRIKGRGKETPDRRAKRYLDHFDEIWGVQTFLMSEADRLDVPVVVNDDLETAVDEVTEHVMAALLDGFAETPESVFGA